jgi:transcriptional regulator with XRE-family HTH domain
MEKTAAEQQVEFGKRLKGAREKAGKLQRELADKLGNKPTTLTHWENGRIEPPLEMLGKLCDELKISPLDLLDKKYSFDDIVKILGKPVDKRTYQERVALTFSRSLLEKLMPAELQRREIERTLTIANFIQNTNVLTRFGGSLNQKELEPLMREYADNGDADKDILFAFHALTPSRKAALLDMIRGLLVPGNVREFNGKMNRAVENTQSYLLRAAYEIEFGEQKKQG